MPHFRRLTNRRCLTALPSFAPDPGTVEALSDHHGAGVNYAKVASSLCHSTANPHGQARELVTACGLPSASHDHLLICQPGMAFANECLFRILNKLKTEIKMPKAIRMRRPSPATLRKLIAILIAILAVIFAGYLRYYGRAWSFALYHKMPDIVVLILHLLIVGAVSLRLDNNRDFLVTILASVFLILGIALQVDIADAPGAWFAFTPLLEQSPYGRELAELTRLPEWWPFGANYLDLVLLIPLFICWVFLLERTQKKEPLYLKIMFGVVGVLWIGSVFLALYLFHFKFGWNLDFDLMFGTFFGLEEFLFRFGIAAFPVVCLAVFLVTLKCYRSGNFRAAERLILTPILYALILITFWLQRLQ